MMRSCEETTIHISFNCNPKHSHKSHFPESTPGGGPDRTDEIEFIISPTRLVQIQFIWLNTEYFFFSFLKISFSRRQFPDGVHVRRRCQTNQSRRTFNSGAFRSYSSIDAARFLLLVTGTKSWNVLFLNCINDGNQASVMDVTDSDRCKGLTDPPVWPQYKRLLKEAEKRDVPLYNIFWILYFTRLESQHHCFDISGKRWSDSISTTERAKLSPSSKRG